jgi:hypothetical protein
MAKVERLMTQPDGRVLPVLVDEPEAGSTGHPKNRKAKRRKATGTNVPVGKRPRRKRKPAAPVRRKVRRHK